MTQSSLLAGGGSARMYSPRCGLLSPPEHIKCRCLCFVPAVLPLKSNTVCFLQENGKLFGNYFSPTTQTSEQQTSLDSLFLFVFTFELLQICRSEAEAVTPAAAAKKDIWSNILAKFRQRKCPKPSAHFSIFIFLGFNKCSLVEAWTSYQLPMRTWLTSLFVLCRVELNIFPKIYRVTKNNFNVVPITAFIASPNLFRNTVILQFLFSLHFVSYTTTTSVSGSRLFPTDFSLLLIMLQSSFVIKKKWLIQSGLKVFQHCAGILPFDRSERKKCAHVYTSKRHFKK